MLNVDAIMICIYKNQIKPSDLNHFLEKFPTIFLLHVVHIPKSNILQ